MAKFKEFLVQRGAPNQIETIYEVDVFKDFEMINAVQLNGVKLKEPLYVGVITKRNNRGVTFETFVFNGRAIEVFLSNSDFQPCDQSFVDLLFNQLKS